MTILLHPDRAVVFDLDDTLYKEIDFVHSGFRHLCQALPHDCRSDAYAHMMQWHQQEGVNTFQKALQQYPFEQSLNELIMAYREHSPNISLDVGISRLLDTLKQHSQSVALVTDGRSTTQRAKIRALGLRDYFDVVVVSEELGSEKPDPNNFRTVEKALGSSSYLYIGDNTNKDFLGPNKLGWLTVCLLDDGTHTHKQQFTANDLYLPDLTIDTLDHCHFSFC